MSFRVGVDIGGTLTDIVFLDAGRQLVRLISARRATRREQRSYEEGKE